MGIILHFLRYLSAHVRLLESIIQEQQELLKQVEESYYGREDAALFIYFDFEKDAIPRIWIDDDWKQKREKLSRKVQRLRL